MTNDKQKYGQLEILQLIMNNTQEIIWAIDQNYCLLFANKAYQEALKAAGGMEMLIGVNVLSDEYPKEFIDFWKINYDKCFNNETFKTISTIPFEDGLHFIENSLSPLKDENGLNCGAIVISHDITEQKRNEKLIIGQNELLKLAFDNDKVAWWDWNYESEIVKFSPNKATMIGYSVDEFPVNVYKICELIHPDDYEKTMKIMVEHLQGKTQFYEVIYRIKTKQNTYIYYYDFGKIIERTPEGKPKRLFGIVFNINQQKQIENQLNIEKEKAEDSEEKHRFLFENTIQGVVYQNSTGEIIYANKAAERILGLSLDQMQGRKSIDPNWRSIHEDDSDFPGETHPAIVTLQTGQPVNNAIMGVFNPIINDYTWIKINSIPKFKNGEEKPYQVLATFEDITEIRRKTTELKIAKEKAEESDRLKTQFLLNMSHEIKTPMNAINGFSNMLNNPDLSDEKRKSFTSIIINSSNQLQLIVENILTISALETKVEKTTIQPVCINSLIVELLAIYKTQAFNQNISLYPKQELTDNQSEIFTDRTKITQILTNLITNALKFTHEGYVEFGYNLKNNELEFYVRDTGIGIKPEMQEQIFERFIQVETGLTRRYGGNGLGLSISKGFVELLDGKFWLQSELDKGSTFYFTIPYKPVHEVDKTNSTKLNTNVTTVLVAEDEEYNYLYIEELLIDMDLKLIHAKDGKEAVEICKANTDINLILMDIKMPILDGHTATNQIREFRPELVIIGQSAYTLEQYIEKYCENPFDDYITKPINEDELKQKLMKYIAKQENK